MPQSKDKHHGHLASQKKRRIRGLESELANLKLEGGRFTAKIAEPIRADVTRTIEGSSTIEIDLFDPEGDILRSKLMKRRVDVELDGLWFRLVATTFQHPILTLTFEDRQVAFLRLVTGARKAYRDKVTRAEFILSQVREVKQDRIPVYIPELHKKRPIDHPDTQSQTSTQQDTKTVDRRDPGLDPSAGLTVKGSPANSEQLRNAEIILQVGVQLDAPDLAMVGAITAAIGESEIKSGSVNPSSGAAGVFQLLPSTAANLNVSPRDVAKTAEIFYTDGYYSYGGAIKLANQGESPGNIASMVEGSDAGGSFYQAYAGEAREFVEAFSGGGSIDLSSVASGSISYEVARRYAFQRGENENAWDCIQRLAEEVQFRAFVSAGVFYYISEEKLFQSKVLMHVGWNTEGLDIPSFDWDKGKKIGSAALSGSLKHWAAPPGTMVKLNEDYGPAQGRYLISEITSNLFDDQFTATAKIPMQELPEPAPETVSKTASFGEQGDMTGFTDGGGAGDTQGIDIKGTSPGDPDWGGTSYIFYQFVDKFMAGYGLDPGSRKRPNNTGSGTSDHWVGSTRAFATDYPTYNGESAARGLARELGFNSWSANSYATFNTTLGGLRVRVQILWGAGIDHGDHVHVGMAAQ